MNDGESENENGIPDYSDGFEGVDVGEPEPEEPQKPELDEPQNEEPSPKQPDLDEPESEETPKLPEAAEPEEPAESEPEQPSRSGVVDEAPQPVEVAGGDAAESGESAAKEPTSMNIYYLIAGQTLYQEDTQSMARPFAPAEAKPFHVVERWEYDAEHTFITEIVDRPSALSMWCVFGRDGTKNDLADYGIENRDCDITEVYKTAQELMAVHTAGKRVEIRDPRRFSMNTLIWCLVTVSSVAMLAAMVFAFSRCTKHKKERSGGMVFESESTPLIHRPIH